MGMNASAVFTAAWAMPATRMLPWARLQIQTMNTDGRMVPTYRSSQYCQVKTADLSPCYKKKCHGAQNKAMIKAAIRGLVLAWSLGRAKPRQPTSSPVALKKKDLVEEFDGDQANQCQV